MLPIGEVAGLDAETTKLIIDLSATLSTEFGATEDFLVTREFKAISTMEERHRCSAPASSSWPRTTRSTRTRRGS